jgi:hypothetical protein
VLTIALTALVLAPLVLLVFDFARGARRRNRTYVPHERSQNDGWASPSDVSRD